MANIEDVSAQVVSQLAASVHSDKTKVVADAFRLVIQPEEAYVESDVSIENLEFAAFAVGGLGAAADTPAAGVRASTVVTIPLSDSSGGEATAKQTLVLYGPGDVRGIDYDQIVRRYPAPGTQNAEETVLAHIEFDRPELPWAFSAARAENRLRPWVTLIVVEKAKARWLPTTSLLPLLEVPLDELPKLDGAHLWAHAQVAVSGTVPLTTRLSPEYSPVNLSRLVSPRVLKEETDYIAAVVPSTDVGSRAGRGVTGGTLDPAWSASSTDPVILPVYDSWEFRTGEDGDFATIALRLDGVVAPYEVGRRFIDASEPGSPLASLPDGEPGAKQVLRCALISPTPPPPDKVEAENASWPAAKTDELRTQLDLPAKIEGSEEPTANGLPKVPILGPRIYAKLHRGATVITGNDWFAELNLSPMHRIVGGLGNRVVQRDQEQLMQAAWVQLGDVERANRAIALAQLAELVATRLHARLSALEPSRLLLVAAPLATRISLTPGSTLKAEVAASATPTTVLTGAFRRSLRPDGPVLRRSAVATRERAGRIAGDGAQTRDFTRTYSNPDGIGRISGESIGQLDQRLVASGLGVAQETVKDVLLQAGAALGAGVFATLADSSKWRAPQRGFDPAAVVAHRWSEVALRDASVPALATIREQRMAPLVAELALAKASRELPVRGALEDRAKTLNNSLIVRLGARAGDAPAAARAVGGAGRGVAIVRGNAIGGAVARVPVVRVGATPAAAAGRRATGIRGLLELDVRSLTRVTKNTSAEARAEAFGSLAGLAVRPVTPVLESIEGLTVQQLRAAIPALLDSAGVLSIPAVPRRDTVAVASLPSKLDPGSTVREALRGRLTLSPELAGRVFAPERIRRVMAGPVFRRPMYQALADYGREWLIPGLGLLPDTDFVTVLSTNSAFMEAFLVGLSDEFGRELLWRNYPTDRAGTYFRRFWDDEQDELAQPIHAFSKTGLGKHIAIGGDGGSEPRAVIIMKSELVRRYPDVIIQVVKNHGTPAAPQFDGPAAIIARQLFAAHLEPDIALVGVDLGMDEIDKPDWWITIAEHPTATRFDRPRDANMGAKKFLEVAAADSGADYAKERLHSPVRVAFHATDLVKREN